MDPRTQSTPDARQPLAWSPRVVSDRGAWADWYARVRTITMDLVKGLSAEDQQVQSMPDASPTKWHLAHTAWFFETFLLTPFVDGYRPVDPRYGYLFNSYYEAVGERHPRPDRGLLTRPSNTEVIAYRRHVDVAMLRSIGAAGSAAWSQMAPLLELGLNHEQQHQELILMDIKHALSRNPLRPVFRDRSPTTRDSTLQVGASRPRWIEVDGGLGEIGHDGAEFAFDNEGPRHKVWLEPFRLADRLSTNGDYLRFVEDGGYGRPDLWLSDGWAAVRAEGWRAPLYWRQDGGDWGIFSLAGERPVDENEPVCHLSYYEADAFARWSGARLPTEAEWEWAAVGNAGPRGAVMEDGGLHPAAAPDGDGLKQMIGDVWEWTASAYLPYPGYRPATGAVGEYNGKFMSGQMVLRGGACVTPADHVRSTYRNFFPPHARWAFSGVRLANDAS